MITYDKAVTIAQQLRQLSPAIVGVELFGSVLRHGHGRDADFFILVDEQLAKRWWTEEQDSIRVRWPEIFYGQRWIVKKFIPIVYEVIIYKRKRKRLQVSADILGLNLEALADSKGKIPDFEMFLVPAGWRNGTVVNIDVMSEVTTLVSDRNTFGFLKRSAKDATKVA